ncbi:DODA-type extradiol aromatic ring-opening family dioxygenase [Paludibacterium paludis]|uniref:Dioxygenase n=1 Tax=Paludibacterium paludis TaxID=1225769 RepID=A0A918UBT3_9NEIS|nr:class III extradiol ring-cleavage dioxygenase [Paludibacterium paludis]GGY28255.1 dioxygenase [Paludibacterium paludis]
MTSRLPTLFLSHGSPMLAIEAGPAVGAWRELARDMPRPRAILAVSAHWGTLKPALTGSDAPATIHDFGGFPEPLYQIDYPAPGDAALAGRAAAMLGDAGFDTAVNPTRGLDHGAWVPLRAMYPDADIPVVQLALQPREDARHHFRLGETLAALRDEGVLILASGSLTHNLWDLVWGADENDPRVPDYVRAFQDWMGGAVLAGDAETAFGWEAAPGGRRAHPTSEHLLPLFVAWGAAGGGASRVHAGISEGALAMDVYRFD